MRALPYVRVSSEEQVREGLSLGVQEARLRAFCTAKSLDLERVYTDAGRSAKSTNRPAFQALVQNLHEGDVVVACKLDRLFRNTRDALDFVELLKEKGAELACIDDSIDTTTPTGNFIFTLFASLAQLERDQTSERTRRVIAALRDSGRKYGPAPFGKRAVGGMLRIDLGDQRAIAEIRHLHASGSTLRSIAEWLQKNGPAPPRGKGRWYASTVRILLRRSDGLRAEVLRGT